MKVKFRILIFLLYPRFLDATRSLSKESREVNVELEKIDKIATDQKEHSEEPYFGVDFDDTNESETKAVTKSISSEKEYNMTLKEMNKTNESNNDMSGHEYFGVDFDENLKNVLETKEKPLYYPAAMLEDLVPDILHDNASDNSNKTVIEDELESDTISGMQDGASIEKGNSEPNDDCDSLTCLIKVAYNNVVATISP